VSRGVILKGTAFIGTNRKLTGDFTESSDQHAIQFAGFGGNARKVLRALEEVQKEGNNCRGPRSGCRCPLLRLRVLVQVLMRDPPQRLPSATSTTACSSRGVNFTNPEVMATNCEPTVNQLRQNQATRCSSPDLFPKRRIKTGGNPSSFDLGTLNVQQKKLHESITASWNDICKQHASLGRNLREMHDSFKRNGSVKAGGPGSPWTAGQRSSLG
jgi:hypothetical protein